MYRLCVFLVCYYVSMHEMICREIANTSIEEWIRFLENRIHTENLSLKEISYIKRIIRVLRMPDLTQIPWHPLQLILERILSSSFYKDFDCVVTPEVVTEWETFDVFHFPENHVARRPSDSYFLQKSENHAKSILLRPHTSVMWFYYLVCQDGKEKLQTRGEVKALSFWKVYRVDELDNTHHECFHQIDGLYLVEKAKTIITQEILKEVLGTTIKIIFWPDIEYRFHKDEFPYTRESLEAEVFYDGKWMEVLGAGVVQESVLGKLWIDSEKYNGWAFGFWLERMAMLLKRVFDIRVFWSKDPRITSQWGNFDPFVPVSDFPATTRDISFLVKKYQFIVDEEETQKKGYIQLTKDTESDFFDIASIARDVSWNIIESIRIHDIFEDDDRFWKEYKSVCIRITFRSFERTLSNDEVNEIYFTIRRKMEEELWFQLR